MNQSAPRPKVDRWNVVLLLLMLICLRIAIRHEPPPASLTDFAWAVADALVVPVILLLAFRFYPPWE